MKVKRIDMWVMVGVISLITLIMGGIMIERTYPEIQKVSKEENIFSQILLEDKLVRRVPKELGLRDIYSGLLVLQNKKEARNFFIVKDKDGFLYEANYFDEVDQNIEKYAERMKTMQEVVQSKGADFFYVGASGKGFKGVGDLIEGYPNDTVNLRNMDELFLRLSYHQIDTIDLRKLPMEEHRSYEMNYYRTHSIWKDSAAFDTAVQIMDKLNQQNPKVFTFDASTLSRKNYREDVYPKAMNGDLLQGVGRYFTQVDDLVLLVPDFTVDLTYLDLNPGSNILRRGGYYDSIINPLEFERRKQSDFDATKVYYGDDVKHFRLTNNQVETGAKILLFVDDYFVTTTNYLALMNKEIEVVVLEENHESEIEELVEGESYDAVIVATKSRNIREELFQFYK